MRWKPGLISLLQDYPLPVVLVNRYLKALDLDVVTVDNYRCGYLATTYLQQKGHTKIAHIAGPESSITCQNRCRGYMDAMRDADLPVIVYIAEIGLTRAAMRSAHI